MSFYHNGVLVTLNNYLDIFMDLSVDIKDEIRSAILDGTPISRYIKPCENDSYKLNQIRLALREYIPEKYINTRLSGECINLIRRCINEKVDITQLDRYLLPSVYLDSNYIKNILHLIILGCDISKLDFNKVPKSNLKTICKGLSMGYPMWLVSDLDCSTSYMNSLYRAMSLGIDIHPFLNNNWSVEQLRCLCSLSKHISISDLLENVNYKFSTKHLYVISMCIEKGYPYELLCAKDDDGSPLFSSSQMHSLIDAMSYDCLDDVYDYNLSNLEMRNIIENKINS